MYIQCYSATETNFDHHGEFKVWIEEGKGHLYRTLNGPFYSQFTVGHDELFVSYLQPRMIVKIPTPHKKNPDQLFRIVEVSDDETGVLFTAYHLVWDLATGFLPHINIVAQTRLEACRYILDQAQNAQPHHFQIFEIDPRTEQKNLQVVRYNPLVALMGSEDNTVLNRFGKTEFDFDNFNLYVYDRLGQDTGFLIKENKNLTSYTKELDYKPLATRIVPQGANELLLPEYYIDSPKINDYDTIFYKHVEFPEIGVNESEGITREIALNQLREAAQKLFTESQIDQPSLSWTVVFEANLEDGLPDELKQLLKLDLGDSVIILKDGIRLEARILEYTYDFISNSYQELTISHLSKSLSVSIDQAVADLIYRVDTFKSIITNLDQTLFSKIEQEIGSVRLEVSQTYSTKKETQEQIDEINQEFKQEITNSVAGLQDQNNELIERFDEAFSDNVLSSHEKVQLQSDLRVIDSQFETMKTMVTDFNDDAVTGQFSALTLRHQELHDLVDPLLVDLNVATEASNAAIREKLYQYQLQYNITFVALQTMIDNRLNTLTTTVNTTAQGVEMAITKSNSALDEVEMIGKHFNFTDSGWVEIFATVNGVPGRFKTQITDQRLGFLDNNVEVAYMSNQQLYITRAQILESLQLGNISMSNTAKGGLIYQWKGE